MGDRGEQRIAHPLGFGGGALGLFTAVSRLRAIHHRIAPALGAAGLPLYAQHVDGLDRALSAAVGAGSSADVSLLRSTLKSMNHLLNQQLARRVDRDVGTRLVDQPALERRPGAAQTGRGGSK